VAPTKETSATKELRPTKQSTRSESAEATPTKATARAIFRSASTTIEGTDPVKVDIVLLGAEDLFGVQFRVAYDPKILRVQDANPSLPDIQLEPGPAFRGSSVFVALNEADPDEGVIDFVATLLGDAKPLAGDVVVASLSLQAVGAGTTTLDFRDIKLANAEAKALSVVGEQATLTVRP